MTETSNTSDYTVPLWIDGKEVHTDTTFDVHSPLDSKLLWKCSGASKKEAILAVESSERAFKSWRKTKPTEIRKILLKAADLLEADVKKYGDYQTKETGVADITLYGFMMPATIEMLRDVAGRAVTRSGTIPDVGGDGKGAFVFKEPFGVNLAIAPWNAPWILGARGVLYAIATGNTAVLKGSELSPRVFWALGQVMHEAGLPAGVLNVIYHRPEDAAEVTNTLIERPEVKKVNFTGSTAVGSIVASKCGKELKPCVMELGGKASAIVCKDADLQNAGFETALGAFDHSGQICMSTERILVDRSILEPFTEELKKSIEMIYPSSEKGPILVAKPAVQKNKKLVEDAVSKGAKLVYGDLETATNKDNEYRLRPFVLTGLKKDMDLYYNESFGPSVSLIPFDTEEEAIAIANDTEYGLSGAVFTENLGRGIKIAKEIETGAVHINQMTVHDESSLPHGGSKKSGWGRFNSEWGMEEFVRTKTISYKYLCKD